MKAITEQGLQITLEDRYEIKRGGEGKILTVPELPGKVAKIYLNPNYQHMSKAQKDALSVLDDAIFIKPLELIYDLKKRNPTILGFTMDFLAPDFLPLSAFFNKNFCAAQHIDYPFKTELSKKLTQAVQSAHRQDIIIGDLSGLNVMVNLQGEIRFLDVDSYETPVHSHWGLLFDEIRDYLYQGKVSRESDYFALGVLIFNLFTHLHPFKGIHKQYKAMAERMIQRLPVFVQDPDMIIPKCYTPVNDPHLQIQFVQLFQEGKRFPIQITQPLTVQQTVKTVVPAFHIQTTLKVHEIYQPQAGESIRYAHFTHQLGFIRTQDKIRIFDVSNHGYTLLKHTLADVPGEIFIGEKNVYHLHRQKLEILDEKQRFVPIENVQFSDKAQFKTIGNILVVLDQDYMRFLYLDQVIQNQIHTEQTPAFTLGFDVFHGLIQNAGGVQYVFYHSGKTISTVKASRMIKSVLIVNSVGLAAYEDHQSGELSLKYEYFNLNNLQMNMSGVQLSGERHFASKVAAPGKGLIFEPGDDLMLVRKQDDFSLLQEIPCNLLSTDTHLLMTQAGIIAYEKDFCYLLNSN